MGSGYGSYHAGYEMVQAQQAEMHGLRAQERLARQARAKEGAATHTWLALQRVWPIGKKTARRQDVLTTAVLPLDSPTLLS